MAKNGGCFIGSAFSCIDILAYLYSNVFDIEKIEGNLKVRRAKKNEIFIGLDNKTYTLNP